MTNQNNDDSRVVISANGTDRQVQINTPPDSSVAINAKKVSMLGVEEHSSGGEIQHSASELTQIDGFQSATNRGRIINSVDGGQLTQIGMEQSADSDGTIINQIKKNARPLSILVVLAVGSDLITWLSSGKHFWDLVIK